MRIAIIVVLALLWWGVGTFCWLWKDSRKEDIELWEIPPYLIAGLVLGPFSLFILLPWGKIDWHRTVIRQRGPDPNAKWWRRG